ncbi:MAG: phosphoglucosamine mutase [Phycisphaerales bacterium]|nr:phosphoglucosamine mutase [Phycisphaerales bacterium]
MTTAARLDEDAPLMLSVSGARGIVGRSFTPAVAASFAAAFGGLLRAQVGERTPLVVLGRDGRVSGQMVAAAAAAGLASAGCRIVDLGVAMTPTVGVAVLHHGADGGMVATASHNPIEWNGLKCIDRHGGAPPSAVASAVIDAFRTGRIRYVDSLDTGAIRTDAGADAEHIDRVLQQVDAPTIRRAAFRVVLDSVNGAGCGPGRFLLEQLGCAVSHLNGEQTGVFAHVPEPTETNLGDLCRAVREQPGVACGFAQDPDGDRLAIVDEQGCYLGEEYTLVLAAQRFLERRGGGPIAVNLSTSRMIDDLAARHRGASVIRTAVGEANVAAAMRARGASIGGEGNGGVVVPEVCWIRDSLVAMALVLDLLAAEQRPLSAIVASLPRYQMIKHKLDLSAVGGVAAVRSGIDRVKSRFADQRINDADGVRVDFADGWVHLRPSNTEPIARLIAEAETRERAWEIIDEVAVAAGLA